MKLFDSFKSETWAKLNETQRLAALQKLEDHAAKEQNRDSRIVRAKEMPNLGSYSAEDPCFLNVNRSMLRSNESPSKNYDLMNTVLHEGRHAFQDDAINGKIKGISPDSPQVQHWAHNFPVHGGFYYDGINNGSMVEYYYQPIEADANSFAHDKMKEYSSHYQSDENFGRFHENRKLWDNLYDNIAQADYGKNYKAEINKQVEQRYAQIQQERGKSKMAFDFLKNKQQREAEKQSAQKREPQGQSKFMAELKSQTRSPSEMKGTFQSKKTDHTPGAPQRVKTAGPSKSSGPCKFTGKSAAAYAKSHSPSGNSQGKSQSKSHSRGMSR